MDPFQGQANGSLNLGIALEESGRSSDAMYYHRQELPLYDGPERVGDRAVALVNLANAMDSCNEVPWN